VSEAAPVRRRARRGEGAALREEILRAAMDLLRETGDADAVSVRAVAQRVGVSVPSLYLHFSDKQALLDAVCEEVFAQLDSALRDAAREAGSPFEALRRQGGAYVRFARDHPEHYRLVMMTSHAGSDRSVDELLATGAFAYLVESVQACVDEGILEGDPVALALSLWASAHGVAALLVAKPYFPWPDVEALVDRTICMSGLGLAALSRLDPDRPLSDTELAGVLDRLR
jgi:AcrR family transcriptional regulator